MTVAKGLSYCYNTGENREEGGGGGMKGDGGIPIPIKLYMENKDMYRSEICQKLENVTCEF